MHACMWKVTTSFVTSHCMSTCNGGLPPSGFHEITCLELLLTSVNTFQLWLKQHTNSKHFVWRPIHKYDLSSRLVFIIETDCVLCDVCAEAQETVSYLILCSLWGAISRWRNSWAMSTIYNLDILCPLWGTNSHWRNISPLSMTDISYQLLQNTNYNSLCCCILMVIDSKLVAKFLRNHGVCQNNEYVPRNYSQI